MATQYDVIIVGGGIAGLSAAIILGRSLRSVAVIDAGEPRNAPAAGVHNYPGSEGAPPLELLRQARAEAESYGAVVLGGEVAAARREDGLFDVTLASGEGLSGRRLVLATGLVDRLPAVEGLQDFWGTSVIHCPYCHGYEVRGTRVGVLATGPMAPHQALLMRQLTDTVTFFSHGVEIDAESRARFDALGIEVVGGEVASVAREGDRLSGLVVDGRTHALDAVITGPRFEARTALYESLGGEVTEHPSGMGTHIAVEMGGKTAVEGVYAVGNAADITATVIVAAAAGTQAGGFINGDLVMEEADAAVAARTGA